MRILVKIQKDVWVLPLAGQGKARGARLGYGSQGDLHHQSYYVIRGGCGECTCRCASREQ